MPLKKIVVIGPESTGKSTLCEGLARHFSLQGPSDWVPEYAREYLLKYGKKYQYADLMTMAKGQLALEEAHAIKLQERVGQTRVKDSGEPIVEGLGQMNDDRIRQSKRVRDPILFIDTDMYVMKVWSEFVFGRCDAWILDQVVGRSYDGYLLCRTDLPWTADELREYPDDGPREELFHIYKDCMINQSTPWREIGGQADERLLSGIAAVKEMLRLV